MRSVSICLQVLQSDYQNDLFPERSHFHLPVLFLGSVPVSTESSGLETTTLVEESASSWWGSLLYNSW